MTLELVNCASITDKGHARLVARLPLLTNVAFRMAACGYRTAKALSALPALRTLNLSHSLSSEPARMLKHIFRSTSLCQLDLRHNYNLTDEDLHSAMDQNRAHARETLRRLIVAHCRLLTDECVRELVQFTGLVELSLRATPIGNDGVAGLGALSLRDLDLTGCWNVSSVGMVELLRRSQSMERLSLARTGVNIEGLLDASRTLSLRFLDIRNSGFFELERLTPALVRNQALTLDTLRVASASVSGDALVSLGQLNFSDLDVSFCLDATESALSLMLMQLGSLRKLGLRGMPQAVHDPVMQVAALRCHHLREVLLCASRVTDYGVMCLSSLPVTKLCLCHCAQVGGDLLAAAVDRFQHLSDLSLFGCVSLLDLTLAAFRSQSLELLDVCGTHVSAGACACAVAELPALRVLATDAEFRPPLTRGRLRVRSQLRRGAN